MSLNPFAEKTADSAETVAPEPEKTEKEMNAGKDLLWEDLPISFEPLLNRVLVLEMSSAEKTRGGLILPRDVTAQGGAHDMMLGRVMTTGPGKPHPSDTKELMDVAVKRGQVVAFEKYKGQHFVREGIKYRILWDTEILGVIPGYDAEEQFA